MSGGSMEYVYHRIQDAADKVLEVYAEECEKLHKGEFDPPCQYYVEEYPDYPFLQDPSGKLLKINVAEKLALAYMQLRIAAMVAERVEWLTSGDDGYEAFILRLSEDAEKLREDAKRKVEWAEQHTCNGEWCERWEKGAEPCADCPRAAKESEVRND